jgi:hypothetical protein
MSAYDDFWEYSYELSLIRDFAHSRVGSPWAYLGAIMARAVTAIPYNVVLPASIGRRVSTGLYVALVGDAGQGKGSSDGAAEDLMPFRVHTARLGSGEGIAHQYAYRDKDRTFHWRDHRSILFESSEAETLKALATRNSSTLWGEVRSAWMGEGIGFGYSDFRKSLPLEALGYRMSILASFTPSMGDVLLDGIAEGTPQRFLFLPVNDPDLPDEDDTEDVREHIDLNVIDVDEGKPISVKVPGFITGTIRDSHREKVRREFGSIDENELLDTHINLVRLKVAFAIGIIHPHRKDYRITRDDWELSGYVMDKSRETRDKLIAAAEAARDVKDKKEGKSLGKRYAASDEVRKIDPVAERIIKILRDAKKSKHEWVAGGKLRNAMSPAQRGSFDEAAALLERTGRIESQPTIITVNNRVLGVRFRLLK